MILLFVIILIPVFMLIPITMQKAVFPKSKVALRLISNFNRMNNHYGNVKRTIGLIALSLLSSYTSMFSSYSMLTESIEINRPQEDDRGANSTRVTKEVHCPRPLVILKKLKQTACQEFRLLLWISLCNRSAFDRSCVTFGNRKLIFKEIHEFLRPKTSLGEQYIGLLHNRGPRMLPNVENRLRDEGFQRLPVALGIAVDNIRQQQIPCNILFV